MASEMPIALDENNTSFQINLREGITWSDGEKFTVDDVIFTIEALIAAEDELSEGVTLDNYVANCEKLDDYSMIINCDVPWSNITESLFFTNGFAIIPKHIYENEDIATFEDSNPVNLGAYKLVKRDQTSGTWSLWEKRDDWKNSAVGVISGEPNPKYILFQYYSTEETRTMALVNNDIDMLCNVTPEAYKVMTESSEYISAWSSEFPYGTFDDVCARGMKVACNNGAYSDANFRWALALAMDIQEVAITAFNGQLRVTPVALAPTKAMMDAYIKPMTDWLNDFKLDDGYAPFNPNYATELAAYLTSQGVEGLPTDEQKLIDLFGIGWWKYDTTEASALMEKAGFELVDGKWNYDGEPFQITILAPSGFEVQSERMATAVADQWRKFGLDVEVVNSDSSVYWGTFTTGYDGVYSNILGCGYFSTNLLSVFMNYKTDNIVELGTYDNGNNYRWGNSTVDALIAEMGTLDYNDTKNTELATQILKQMVIEMPCIPMYSSTMTLPTNSYYWTNYPTADNAYNGPWWWHTTFKYMLPEITSTGK
ncbi:MAG: ABC transporter substrate-binding protein [Eubacteriales bacterium]|nr:ABC transporter substrate-binding protein [Eubacteriales bacterium]